jgi:hypothetical protein
MGQIKTSDLPLAAALCLTPTTILKAIEDDTTKDGKKWFVVESNVESSALEDLATRYFNNLLQVDAKSYSQQIKNLKSMMFSIKK